MYTGVHMNYRDVNRRRQQVPIFTIHAASFPAALRKKIQAAVIPQGESERSAAYAGDLWERGFYLRVFLVILYIGTGNSFHQ